MRLLNDTEIALVSGGDKPTTFVVVAIGDHSTLTDSVPTSNQAAHQLARTVKDGTSGFGTFDTVKVAHNH